MVGAFRHDIGNESTMVVNEFSIGYLNVNIAIIFNTKDEIIGLYFTILKFRNHPVDTLG